jgi:ATPase subunit of ABC transporter with duplicated ATPase domains
MSTLLTAKDITLHYNSKTYLDDLTFILETGDIIGLVGKNGCGKTSLMRILAGLQDYDGGSIEVKTGKRIGYLPQDFEFDQELTIEETLQKSTLWIKELIKKYEVLNQVKIVDTTLDQQKHDLLTQISDHHGWDLEAHIDMLCKNFDVPDRSKVIKECSGGQQRRVALACALIGLPSILVLDEPTNHLDLIAIENLEKLIKGYNGAVLIVSHDRYFLDNCANKMWELHSGKFFQHAGNYSKYLENKAIRVEIENSKNWKKQQYLKRELEWVRQGVKARGTKDKGRMKRFYEAKDDSGLEKDLSINLILPEPKETGARVLEMENIYLEDHGQWIAHDFTFSFQPGQKIGIIGGNGVGKSTFLKLMMGEYTKERITFDADAFSKNESTNSKASDNPTPSGSPFTSGNLPTTNFDDEDFDQNLNVAIEKLPLETKWELGLDPSVASPRQEELEPQADWGFNSNELEPSQPTLKGTVKVGINTEYLYFDQKKVGLDRENSPFEELTETNEQMFFGNKLISTHRYLQNWLFDKTKRNTAIKYLSGGEKSRLMLAKILAQGGNFLILDEPTNDLDLDTLRVLEENLEVFPGTVAIVSHDRYFLNRICDYIFAFEGNGAITISTGNYDDYIGKKMDPMLVKSYREMLKKQKQVTEDIEKNKRGKIKKIESDIAVVEKKLAELQSQFDDPDFYLKDPTRATKVHRLITERERELEKLMQAWETFQASGVVKDEIIES